jgi:hypothetical protein
MQGLFLSAEQIPHYRQRHDEQHAEDGAATDAVHAFTGQLVVMGVAIAFVLI